MTNMIIISMFGDLGNQLYQYVFFEYIQKYFKIKCIIDDSYFWKDEGFIEIEGACNIKFNRLSTMFTKDVWDEMISLSNDGIPIVEQLYHCGLDLVLLEENNNFRFSGKKIKIDHNKLYKEIGSLIMAEHENLFFYAEFNASIYLNLIGDEIFQKLKFKPLLPSLEANTINQIYKEVLELAECVGVYYDTNNLNENMLIEYREYLKAMSIENKEYEFFIFSNEIIWCKKNLEKLGVIEIKNNCMFVEENIKKEDRYIDIQLMSLCKKLIIPNTAFAKWGYYFNRLCEKKDLIIIGK